MMAVNKKTTGMTKRESMLNCSLIWTKKLFKLTEKIRSKATKGLKLSHSETSSIIRKEQIKPSIYQWERKVWKLTHQSKVILLQKLLNGKSLMHIWINMKKHRELTLKKQWKIKKIRTSLFKFNNNMLKILYILTQWKELSRLWKEWSSKMLMMKSLKTISTMKTTLRTEKMETMVQFYHFGVSLLLNLKRNM